MSERYLVNIDREVAELLCEAAWFTKCMAKDGNVRALLLHTRLSDEMAAAHLHFDNQHMTTKPKGQLTIIP